MITELIKEAQRRLVSNPCDLYHELGHHYKVWENSVNIVYNEKLPVDLGVIEVAAWIHDIDKGKKDNFFLHDLQTKYNLDTSFTQKVELLLNEHSYGNKQSILESKVLFDADKIELVSVARWQFVFQAYDEGIVSRGERDKYINPTNERIPNLLNNLHFTYSNNVFISNLKAFTSWIAQNKLYKKDTTDTKEALFSFR